jgi:hypothetical protein
VEAIAWLWRPPAQQCSSVRSPGHTARARLKRSRPRCRRWPPNRGPDRSHLVAALAGCRSLRPSRRTAGSAAKRLCRASRLRARRRGRDAPTSVTRPARGTVAALSSKESYRLRGAPRSESPVVSGRHGRRDRFDLRRRRTVRHRNGDVPIAGDQLPGLVSSAATGAVGPDLHMQWGHSARVSAGPAIGEEARVSSRSRSFRSRAGSRRALGWWCALPRPRGR